MKAKHHLLGFDRCFVPAVVKNQQTYIRGYVLDDEACSKMLITVKLASLVTLTDITFMLFVGLSISLSKVGMAGVLPCSWSVKKVWIDVMSV